MLYLAIVNLLQFPEVLHNVKLTWTCHIDRGTSFCSILWWKEVKVTTLFVFDQFPLYEQNQIQLHTGRLDKYYPLLYVISFSDKANYRLFIYTYLCWILNIMSHSFGPWSAADKTKNPFLWMVVNFFILSKCSSPLDKNKFWASANKNATPGHGERVLPS